MVAVPGTEPAGAVPPVSETSAENGPARVEGPARDGLGMTGDEIRPRQFAFGPFRLFPEQQLLLEGESPVRLGGRARDLLIALLERAGQVITKEALSARLWPNIVVEEGTLRVHVAALRKALRDGQEGRRYIANVAGRGYSFVGKVVANDEPEPAADAPPEPLPPLSMARLFGRAEVVETLSNRLAQQRLITITGPGGIGKTSVALAVADRMRAGLPDGVCVVDFAPLADSKLVPTALASALGIGVVSEDPLPNLVALLRNREMLIVLDNCEHVIDTAALLAESLLRGSTKLRILATSRESMRVSGEILFRLAPLAMPEVSDVLTAPIAMTYSAVQLFVERAAMCLGEFSLTDAHAPAVANICSHLDGIPLAIEMAAGRVDAFGIAGLADVLDDRFRLAMRGRRTALPRHQTLSTTLDWSYQLLPEAERLVCAGSPCSQGSLPSLKQPVSSLMVAVPITSRWKASQISLPNRSWSSVSKRPLSLTGCSKRRAPTRCKSWKRAASVPHTPAGTRDNVLPPWRRPTLRGKPRLRMHGLQDTAI